MRYMRWALTAALIGATAIAVGCGDDDDGGGNGETPSIAIVSYANTDYIQAEEIGVKKAVEEAGGTAKLFNANFDPVLQNKQCTDVVASGRYNGIILNGVSAPTSIPCAKAAAAANIPIVALDQPIGKDPNGEQPSEEGVVSQVVMIPDRNAAGIAEITTKACAGKNPCKVIVEIANTSDPLTTTAAAAVKKLPGVEVVGEFSSNYDPGAVAKAMPDLLQANPDANVFVSAADSSALAALDAIKDAGMTESLTLVANGGSRLGAEAVKDGTIFATLGNWPEQYGGKAAELLIQAINGDEVKETFVDETKIDSPFILTKDNIGEFTPEWGATAQ